MIRLNLEQGSDAWHAWRKSVITATVCPAILGISPYDTAYQCWQRILGLLPEKEVTERMKEGSDWEPIARAKFIEDYNMLMEPCCVESAEYNFLGASLDGISTCGRYLLEIKRNGNSIHENIMKHLKIPDFHMAQMQHQLLVTGAEKCYYDSNGFRIEVFPDAAFVKDYLPKARAFWRCVALEIPPELTDRDYKSMEDNAIWCKEAKTYSDLDKQIKELEERKEATRTNIIQLCANQPSVGHGLKVSKTVIQGRVAYGGIPELKGVDLEQHRGAPTQSWRITLK